MTEISASILNLEKDDAIGVMYNLETAKINYYHIDVMDGKFVERNNIEMMKDYALTASHISNLGTDVHLMVENVEDFVDDYLSINPQIITFHIEATKTEERTNKILNTIKENGSRAGLAISPDTSIDLIKPYLDKVHMILVMTVVPGLGGQKLIPSTIEKVKELKKYVDENNYDIDIEVDGGINNETAPKAVEAGANILVVGNYLLKSDNFNETVKLLKNS